MKAPRVICSVQFWGFLVLFCGLGQLLPAAERLPNVILILADDLGYADIGVYGAKGFATPNLDRLAREGTRFTDFHVAQAVCSASRAALLTACYPNRVGIEGAMEPWYDWATCSRIAKAPAFVDRAGRSPRRIASRRWWTARSPARTSRRRRG